MSDTYQIGQGQSNAPGLPPINLPSFGEQPRVPLKITVGKQPTPKSGPEAAGLIPFDPNEIVAPPKETKDSAGALAAGLVPFDPSEVIAHEPQEPSRQVGMGESVLTGVKHGASFGLAPAISGLSEAAGPVPAEGEMGLPSHSPVRPIVGGLKMLHEQFFGHPELQDLASEKPTPSVMDAYHRGRKAALEDEKLAKEQHPVAYLGGVLAGGAAMPVFGGLTPAATGGRIIQGMRGGAIGGAAYGGGEAVSENLPAGDVAKHAVVGGGIGSMLGGAVGGAIGPRVVNPASPGSVAARTAEGLGAPLPRGVASDSRGVQATTAKMRQLPFVGERIGQAVEETQRAAGGRIEGIADRMTGGATDRAVSDALVRPGLQTAIDTNRAAIDAAYNALRGQINLTQRYTMPHTDAALGAVVRERQAAGHVNPAQGLEQFENVARGATFNGAHRARVDARNAGDAVVPHPGYNAADYNRLTRAMTADLRAMAQAAATNQTPAGRHAALQAFDRAEQEFGPLAQQNRLLHRLMNSPGEGVIAKLIGSAKEQGGNLALLRQLRASMNPQEFQQIGGQLLAELGHNPTTGEFSLAKFTTNFDKLSDGALGILFSPQHLQHIRDIAGLGKHIKGALRESTSSHSAGMLVLLDVAKDAVLLTGDLASGGMGLGTAVGAASTAGMYGLARWLGNPATAASMSQWTRAYRGITLNRPTPARIAAFNMTTRNLANTLGVPVQTILGRIPPALQLTGKGNTGGDNENVPRRVGE